MSDHYWDAESSAKEMDRLNAEVAMLREALIKCDAVFQSSRVWGGMEFVMHPISPFKYQPTAKDVRVTLDLLALESGEQGWLSDHDASVRDAAWEDALEEAALIFLADTGYGQMTSQFIARDLRAMKGTK